MSMNIPERPDPTSMQRYMVDSVAFAPDLSSFMVRFLDPRDAGGPILGEIHEQTISLVDDDEKRATIWGIIDQLCDLIDEAHGERRRAR